MQGGQCSSVEQLLGWRSLQEAKASTRLLPGGSQWIDSRWPWPSRHLFYVFRVSRCACQKLGQRFHTLCSGQDSVNVAVRALGHCCLLALARPAPPARLESIGQQSATRRNRTALAEPLPRQERCSRSQNPASRLEAGAHQGSAPAGTVTTRDACAALKDCGAAACTPSPAAQSAHPDVSVLARYLQITCAHLDTCPAGTETRRCPAARPGHRAVWRTCSG